MSPCGRQREYQRKEESNMKKRLLSMVLTVIMLVSLIPTSVFAAKKSVDDYFDGLPIAADPGTGTPHGRSVPRTARRSSCPAMPERTTPPAP